jgi:hypothetical protein
MAPSARELEFAPLWGCELLSCGCEEGEEAEGLERDLEQVSLRGGARSCSGSCGDVEEAQELRGLLGGPVADHGVAAAAGPRPLRPRRAS